MTKINDYQQFDIDKYLAWMRQECEKKPKLSSEGEEEDYIENSGRIARWFPYIYWPSLKNWMQLEADIKEQTDQKIADGILKMNYSPLSKSDFIKQYLKKLLDFLDSPTYTRINKSCINTELFSCYENKGAGNDLILYAVNIKAYQYWLNEGKKLEVSSTIGSDKLIWQNAQLELITVFFDMLDSDLIKASKADVARFLVNNFVDKDRKPFTYSYVYERLKPGAEKAVNRADFKSLL